MRKFSKKCNRNFNGKCKKALEKTNIKTVVLAGGVSANSYIRKEFLEIENEGIKYICQI